MTQKILKVGDSAAVTIPKKSLEELGLEIGDRIKLRINKKRGMVIVEPIYKEVDKELLEWTRKFIEKYHSALEALAKK